MGIQRDPKQQEKRQSDGGEATQLVGPPHKRRRGGVDGITCRALVDSGSHVTTLTHEYWRNHPVLKEQIPQPCKTTMEIEGVGGQSVPYYGVIDLKFNVLGRDFSNVPAFVIPDSGYRTTVPLLVGTNVICGSKSPLQATFSKQFLHRVK